MMSRSVQQQNSLIICLKRMKLIDFFLSYSSMCVIRDCMLFSYYYYYYYYSEFRYPCFFKCL